MLFIKRALFSVFVLLGCLRLQAQDSTLLNKPLRWDLPQCIAYAKKNNIQINSLRLSQQTSQQEYLLARAARFPNLSGTASQNVFHRDNGGASVLTGGSGSNFGASGSYGINSAVTLYNGNYINNNILQKNLAIESANLNIVQQENDITLQITQAYLAVLLDKENVISDTSLVSTSKAQTELEQKRFNVGSVARVALIQLQAQQASDQYVLVSAQNTERGDLLTLKQLLLLPTEADFDIIKPDSIIAKNGTVTPLKDAEEAALKTRPEVKNGELGVQLSQYDVKKAQAGFLPSLSAGGSLTSSYATGQGSYFNQINNNFYQQVGLTLSIPIFTQRIVKTQVEEAKIEVEQSQLTLQNTKITLTQTVERAYINVQNAGSQYDAALVQYQFNQESYRIANEQLKVGVANLVDFLLVKTMFIQSQQAFIQAKYNALLSLKIYDFYRGVPIKL
jgi:outer membrane protein